MSAGAGFLDLAQGELEHRDGPVLCVSGVAHLLAGHRLARRRTAQYTERKRRNNRAKQATTSRAVTRPSPCGCGAWGGGLLRGRRRK